MECLELPIPDFISGAIQEPPEFRLRREDTQALRMIREFGNDVGRTEEEIQLARDLAFGPSDIVIILERPTRPRPSLSLEDYIQSSPTLRAVDELIKLASKGKRSIHNVSILTAYSFQYKEDEKISSRRCLSLLEGILNLKQPKSVLVCTSGLKLSPYLTMQALRSRGVDTWPLRQPETIGTTVCSVFRSFHPSAVLNWNKTATFYRLLLVGHFVLAFGELSEPGQACPEWLIQSDQRALIEKQNYWGDHDIEITLNQLLNCLRTLLGIKCSGRHVLYLNDGEQLQKGVEEVAQLLRRFADSELVVLGYDIYELCFLWKQFSKFVNIEDGKTAMTRLCACMRYIKDFDRQDLIDFRGSNSVIEPTNPTPTDETQDELAAFERLQPETNTVTINQAPDARGDGFRMTAKELTDRAMLLNKEFNEITSKIRGLRSFVWGATPIELRITNLELENAVVSNIVTSLMDFAIKSQGLSRDIAKLLSNAQRGGQHFEDLTI